VAAGESSRARPGVPAHRAGQARQPPARARRASPPRGPGVPAPRAGQAWGARLEAGASARAGQAWGARLEAGASARARPWQPRGQSVVPARRPPSGRRAAVVPTCRHDNGKLSKPYETSKIHHIFVRLPTKFGVIPSWFLFFMNFWIFNGRKI